MGGEETGLHTENKSVEVFNTAPNKEYDIKFVRMNLLLLESSMFSKSLYILKIEKLKYPHICRGQLEVECANVL